MVLSQYSISWQEKKPNLREQDNCGCVLKEKGGVPGLAGHGSVVTVRIEPGELVRIEPEEFEKGQDEWSHRSHYGLGRSKGSWWEHIYRSLSEKPRFLGVPTGGEALDILSILAKCHRISSLRRWVRTAKSKPETQSQSQNLFRVPHLLPIIWALLGSKRFAAVFLSRDPQKP